MKTGFPLNSAASNRNFGGVFLHVQLYSSSFDRVQNQERYRPAVLTAVSMCS